MPELTLTNARGRDAQVAVESACIPVRLRRLDREGRQCQSARILKGTLAQSLPALRQKFPDVGHALIAGDPEINVETVGHIIRPGESKRVYADARQAMRLWSMVRASSPQ